MQIQKYINSMSQEQKEQIISNNFDAIAASNAGTNNIATISVQKTQSVNSASYVNTQFRTAFNNNGGLVSISGKVVVVCGANTVTLGLFIDGVLVDTFFASGTTTLGITYQLSLPQGSHIISIKALSSGAVTVGSATIPSVIYVTEAVNP